MPGFWTFIWIFNTMYPVHPGERWVTAQSITEPPVYHLDKEFSVNIGDSATLRCCITEKTFTMIYLFKQPIRQKLQMVVKSLKTEGDTFYNGFQESRFQIKRSSNLNFWNFCFNFTILNTTQCDEAMYYCALMSPKPVFGDGTYLNITGDRVSVVSETSKPALCDHSVVCEPTRHGNRTTMNTQEKIVLGLGTALGLCAVLIVSLIILIVWRVKFDKMNTSFKESSGMRQIQESEGLNYAALQFPKRKAEAENRKAGLLEGCVYAGVK